MAPRSDEEWTHELAYAVGLIATDGCFSRDGKSVMQTSKDIDLLDTFKRCLGRDAKVAYNQRAFRVQISDVRLYP